MKKIFKLFFYEIKKNLFSKTKLIRILFFLIFFIFACFVGSKLINGRNYDRSGDDDTMEYYVSMSEYYKKNYEYASGIVNEMPDGTQVPNSIKRDKDFFYYMYTKYDFFIRTNSVDIDYVGLKSPMDSDSKYNDGIRQVVFGNIAFFIAFGFSIIISYSICFIDFDRNRVKNIYQAKLSKRKVIASKLLFSIFCLFLFMFLYLFIILTITKFSMYSNCYVFSDSKIDLVPTIDYFVSKCILAFLYGVLIILINATLRNLINNSYLCSFLTIASVSLFFGIFGIYYVLVNDLMKSNQFMDATLFVNALSSQVYYKGNIYYITLAFTLFISLLLFLFCTLFERKVSFKEDTNKFVNNDNPLNYV